MLDDARAVLGGAVAGALATVPMSMVMLAADGAGLMGRQPPKIITDKALDAVGATPSEDERRSAAVVAHVAFGTAAGSAFGVLHHKLELPGGPVAQGIGFGLLVYAVSYAGWIPALNIMPTPPDDRPGRPSSMIAAHMVFGAALGFLANRLVPNAVTTATEQ